MKKALFCILVLISCFTHAQTATEIVAEATEMAADNPNNTNIKTTLETALELEPNNEAALYQLAMYHINRTTDHYALPYLDRLIYLAPNNAEYYWQRAKINIRKNALNKELLQARQDLQKAQELGYADTARIAKAQEYIVRFLN